MDTKANKLDTELKLCQHKVNCCSRDPKHFEAFSHPHLKEIYEKGKDAITNQYIIPEEYSKLAEILRIQLILIETRDTQFNTSDLKSFNDYDASDCLELSYQDVVPVEHEPGKILEKLKLAKPYNLFLTAIKDSKPTHDEPLSITFQELFDKSLGEIESTVHINYMVNFDWLMMHYKLAGIIDKPLLVLYDYDSSVVGSRAKRSAQLIAVEVNMQSEFGIPHSKIVIIGYKDGSMQLVISTANLIIGDWKNRTQALWISPKLKKLPLNSVMTDGDSPTSFRSDFISFLFQYKCDYLKPWIARIQKTDFSEVNVFLIASAPGIHRAGWRGLLYGHPRLGNVLQEHCVPIEEKIPVVCQSSGVGTFGPNIKSWIQQDFLSSFGKDTAHTEVQQYPPLNFIYPSFANVCNGHNGIEGNGWLPYEKSTNDKQLYLRKHLYQWISNGRHRSRAIPHMKCYSRFDLEKKCVFWFLLTSANFSKSAWGVLYKKNQNRPSIRMSNFEAGVLFLPKFVTGEQTFPLDSIRNGVPPFPLPYDVPLKPYGPDDKIYICEDHFEYMEYLRYMLS